MAIGVNHFVSNLGKYSERVSKRLVKGVKILLGVFVVCSVVVWMHLSLYINLAYRANTYTSAFISNQMSSKTLCDLHQHQDPSSSRVKILPWNPAFYQPSKPEIHQLSYLDISGTDFQEKYMLMLTNQTLWSTTNTKYTSTENKSKTKTPKYTMPEYLSLYSSSNSFAMKKTHQVISNLVVFDRNNDMVKYQYKFHGKYFVGIDDRQLFEYIKNLFIEYLVVYKLKLVS
jgi:hypothetical protein